jgi:hypothetical protein
MTGKWVRPVRQIPLASHQNSPNPGASVGGRACVRFFRRRAGWERNGNLQNGRQKSKGDADRFL